MGFQMPNFGGTGMDDDDDDDDLEAELQRLQGYGGGAGSEGKKGKAGLLFLLKEWLSDLFRTFFFRRSSAGFTCIS